MENNLTDIVSQEDETIGRKINPVPKPTKEIGIDTQDTFWNNLQYSGESTQIDIAKLESFTQATQSRETVYELLDTMSEDTTIAAALEIYAEDATEPNDSGEVVWCQSDDANISKMVNFLLDSLNVNKHIYSWAYSLVKYGDLYLRLYRQSDYTDALFDTVDKNNLNNKSDKTLNEDVIINKYRKDDKFVHYIEMIKNPAELFELTKFGKSYAYIKAPISANKFKASDLLTAPYYKYGFQKQDVNVYPPTEFVHAYMEDNSNRYKEEVQIFMNEDENSSISYTVRRGQSLLYNLFKIWRELMLLENAMILNRLTKSSVIRVINVEVGDMPKENVGKHLMGIKNLFEQKTAMDSNKSMSEYTNPGPIENNVYIPTHNGQGTLSINSVGGDVNVSGLGDVDYFKKKLYSGLKIPPQYLGDTDDAAGFNGGTSLSLISSRYAKTVRRIQLTLIEALTDVINIMLLDKGLDSYINKFQLMMQEPTTQEQRDRKEAVSTSISNIRDIIDLFSADIENQETKLKALKILLSNVIDEPEVISLIQEEIDKLEETAEEESSDFDDTSDDDFDSDFGLDDFSGGGSLPAFSDLDMGEESTNIDFDETGELPSGEDLGVDLTDNIQ